VTLVHTFKVVALTAAVSLALAAQALGAPSDSQYLPQVPSATGDKPVSEDPGSFGSSTVADDQANGDGGKDGDSEADLLAGGNSSDDGDSSGGVLDTLLDPIVLLLIAGVLTIAVGMMLARKQGGEGPDPSKAPRKRPDAPATPDGEIIGGQELP
jgi:hypothetical protein